jgi:hypothetical protein
LLKEKKNFFFAQHLKVLVCSYWDAIKRALLEQSTTARPAFNDGKVVEAVATDVAKDIANMLTPAALRKLLDEVLLLALRLRLRPVATAAYEATRAAYATLKEEKKDMDSKPTDRARRQLVAAALDDFALALVQDHGTDGIQNWISKLAAAEIVIASPLQPLPPPPIDDDDDEDDEDDEDVSDAQVF